MLGLKSADPTAKIDNAISSSGMPLAKGIPSMPMAMSTIPTVASLWGPKRVVSFPMMPACTATEIMPVNPYIHPSVRGPTAKRSAE